MTFNTLTRFGERIGPRNVVVCYILICTMEKVSKVSAWLGSQHVRSIH